MTRFIVAGLLAAVALSVVIPASPISPTQVTFNKDVLPILQKNCQTCHRPTGAGPMSFLTYESTRPWARAIKEKVVKKEMPPWFADARYGGFRNAPQLTDDDIKTLAIWADTGAQEGEAKDKPAPLDWVEGWRTHPDVIVSMREPYQIPAKGSGEIKSFLVPSPFKEDTWVTSIEVKPGNPSVVHHVIVQVPEEKISPKLDGFAWGAKMLERDGRLKKRGGGGPGGYGGGGDRDEQELGSFVTMEAVYVPGAPPIDFRFHDSAKLIPGGKEIRLEVHYTPNGKATSDQTMVGFTLAKGPAKRRFVTMAPANMIDKGFFKIPAGASDVESTAVITFLQNAELVWFMPHMHLRGKDMTYRLEYPNGVTDTVLAAKFNFLWQLGYEVEEPIRVPKGTRMIVTAHHDNSANNPFNPNPKEDVHWGELTSQEMVLPWFGVVVDRNLDPASIASYRPTSSAEPEADDRPVMPMPRLGLGTPPFTPGSHR